MIHRLVDNLVGKFIQFFNHIAADIHPVGLAQDVHEAGFCHFPPHKLRSKGNAVQQSGEFTGRPGMTAFAFDDMTLERHKLDGDWSSRVHGCLPNVNTGGNLPIHGVTCNPAHRAGPDGAVQVLPPRKFLILVLQLIQPVIQSPEGKKLLMCTALAELALMHHKDLVRRLNSGQTMGDHNGGPSVEKFFYGTLHEKFCFGVNAGGRFIQHENAGVHRQRPGKRDELLLADRQRRSALFYIRMVLPGQILDEPVSPDDPRGRTDPVIRDNVVP